MIVDALLSKSCCQGSLLLAVLLDLGSLVLEPDLQLVLIQSKLRTQVPPPLLGQILVGKKLLLKSLKLLGVEGCSWFLLSAAGVSLRLPLALSLGSASRRSVRVSGGEDPGRDVLENVLVWQVWSVGGVTQIHGQLFNWLLLDR